MKTLSAIILVVLASGLASGTAVASPPAARAIAVRSEPAGAAILVDGLVAGTDGVLVTASAGSKVRVSCVLLGNDGWKGGRLDLVFDGRVATTTCKLERATRCVDGLQNPFSPCEGALTASVR